MRKVLCAVLLVFFGALISVNASETVWAEDFETALKLSKKQGKPLLLDFTADWCSICRLMEKNFWNRSDVAEISKQLVFVKLDADKNAELKKKYEVKGLPHVILTDPWGEPVDSYIGFGQNGDRVILEKISKLPKDFTVLKQAGELLEKDKTNLSAMREFAEFYEQRKLFSYGIPLYQKILRLETQPEKRENALLALAFSHLALGQSTLALERFDDFYREFPKSAQTDKAIYGVILAQLNKHNLPEAEKRLSALKKSFSGSSFIQTAENKIAGFKQRNKQE